MAKKRWAQIVAFLALFWIIIWIVGTSLLFIFGWDNNQEKVELTPEQYAELQKLIEEQALTPEASSWTILEETTSTWEIVEEKTLSWEIVETSSWETVNTNTWTTK